MRDWSLGIAAGYAVSETSTVRAAVPRTIRSAMPAAGLGIAWGPAAGRMRIGAHARVRRSVGTTQLYSVAGSNRVYQLEGYTEPRPRDILGSTYRRRLERAGYAGGLSAEGALAGVAWVLYWEGGSVTDSHFSDLRIEDPAADVWTANAHTVGAWLSRKLGGGGTALTFTSRWTSIEGNATLARREDTAFVAAEDLLVLEGTATSSWTVGWRTRLRLGTARRRWSRLDLVNHAAFDVTAWTPRAFLELAWEVGGLLSVGVGGGWSQYAPRGEIPSSAELGPVYREYIAPELAMYGSEAASRVGRLILVWRRASGNDVRISVMATSTSGLSQRALDYLPSGSRTTWSMAVGVLVGGT